MNKSRELGKFGYKSVKKLSLDDRHKALKKASKKYGYYYVIKDVGALASFHTRTDPYLSKKLRADQRYLSKIYDTIKLY